MQVGTATPTSYGYNELDQLRTMTTTGGLVSQYSYVRGNLVKVNTVGSSSVVTYTWDSANRLTGVITPTQSSAYTYDADGHRVAQTQGGTTTNYLWDSESSYGDVLLETNGAGAFQASYVLAGGELVSQNKGGVTSYLLKDGQGSTRALFSGGTLVIAGGNQIYSYTAFGSLQTAATTVGTSYLYTGQQLDQPTGLYDLRARYYNPVDGRFLSQDGSIANSTNPDELNRYAYATDNPVNAFDPSGNDSAFIYRFLNRTVQIARPVLTEVAREYIWDLFTELISNLLMGDADHVYETAKNYFKDNNIKGYPSFTIAVAQVYEIGSANPVMYVGINNFNDRQGAKKQRLMDGLITYLQGLGYKVKGGRFEQSNNPLHSEDNLQLLTEENVKNIDPSRINNIPGAVSKSDGTCPACQVVEGTSTFLSSFSGGSGIIRALRNVAIGRLFIASHGLMPGDPEPGRQLPPASAP